METRARLLFLASPPSELLLLLLLLLLLFLVLLLPAPACAWRRFREAGVARYEAPLRMFTLEMLYFCHFHLANRCLYMRGLESGATRGGWLAIARAMSVVMSYR